MIMVRRKANDRAMTRASVRDMVSLGLVQSISMFRDMVRVRVSISSRASSTFKFRARVRFMSMASAGLELEVGQF
jgi:hypothetical protein